MRRYAGMTEDERHLLEDTARSLIRLWEEQRDVNAGVEAALLEIYRAHFTTDTQKHETMARLKLGLKLLETQGQGAKFMSGFLRKLEHWTPSG